MEPLAKEQLLAQMRDFIKNDPSILTSLGFTADTAPSTPAPTPTAPKPRESHNLKECRICLDSILPTEMNEVKCKHCFHNQCLQTWLKKQVARDDRPTCPICRSDCSYALQKKGKRKNSLIDNRDDHPHFDPNEDPNPRNRAIGFLLSPEEKQEMEDAELARQLAQQYQEIDEIINPLSDSDDSSSSDDDDLDKLDISQLIEIAMNNRENRQKITQKQCIGPHCTTTTTVTVSPAKKQPNNVHGTLVPKKEPTTENKFETKLTTTRNASHRKHPKIPDVCAVYDNDTGLVREYHYHGSSRQFHCLKHGTKLCSNCKQWVDWRGTEHAKKKSICKDKPITIKDGQSSKKQK